MVGRLRYWILKNGRVVKDNETGILSQQIIILCVRDIFQKLRWILSIYCWW